MAKNILKDGYMEIYYKVEYHKTNNLLRITNITMYKSDDDSVEIDEKSDEVVIDLYKIHNKSELVGYESVVTDSINNMLICKIEPKMSSFLKKHTKNTISKLNMTDSIDFYSFKYITRATIKYSDGKCSITETE